MKIRVHSFSGSHWGKIKNPNKTQRFADRYKSKASLPQKQFFSPKSLVTVFGQAHDNRITECSGLEGTSVGHPVQPPCRSRVTYNRLHRTMSRQVWNISREGDSTASLGSLCQGSVTLRGKKFFLVFRRNFLCFSEQGSAMLPCKARSFHCLLAVKLERESKHLKIKANYFLNSHSLRFSNVVASHTRYDAINEMLLPQ